MQKFLSNAEGVSSVKLITIILALFMMSNNSLLLAQDTSNEDKAKFILRGEVRDKATGGQLVGAGLRIYNSAD